ncbi:MAG: hypothetical protein LBS62_14385 [Clostridiales bacterium]|jgi:N-acetylglucosamine kinase-like BadF-type ATPase|nr:hypothetical protein [Clostridiales bacterium]
MFFLGVDAGGSKAAFALCDSSGTVKARYRCKSQGAFSLGMSGIEKLVAEGAEEVCKAAGISVGDIAWAGLGFPGYGEQENNESEIDAACARALPGVPVTCACDCWLGWAGSLAMGPGVNIVSGTGSICFGANARGQTARSGGWGEYCDEGSCSWIGRRLIAEFTKQSDGRKPKTPLYSMFREALGITNDIYFIYRLNRDFAGKPDETARLQVLAEKAARAGDPVSRRIYGEAAEELCIAITAVADRLGLNNGSGFLVSYSGGLFKAGDCILTPLAERVTKAGGRLTAPLREPEIGAVFMALRAYDPKADIFDFCQNIKEEYS